MTGVLIDSCVLWDLVFCFQSKHRRNRSVSSSAAAAIECLLFYDEILIEKQSTTEIVNGADNKSARRYLEFYTDDVAKAASQVHDLLGFCKPVDVQEDIQSACYDAALAFIDRNLERVSNPDDLRAYEMYDFLPYHLGEDPTSVECRIDATSASDLEEIAQNSPEHLRPTLLRLDMMMKDRLHPVRGAWVLPLLRLLYYQHLQGVLQTDYVPHATKSTIGFGRETQTIRAKRFIDYCRPDAQEAFAESIRLLTGEAVLTLALPGVATQLLSHGNLWPRLLDQLASLRDSNSIREFRIQLNASLAAGTVKADAPRIASLATHVHQSLQVPGPERSVTVSLPFIEVAQKVPERLPLLLIHQLYQEGS